LKKEHQQGKYRESCKTVTSTHTSSTPLPHKNSSSSQELNVSKGENNEGCLGGGDGDDPPYLNMEKAHVVGQTKRKRITSNKSAQNFEVLKDDLVEIDVDNDNQVLKWEVVWIAKNQQIA